MLVMFRFKNYGPFKDEVVFDMRPVKAYKEHPYNLITENKDNSLLKVAAIYGANASGKSNFVKAYKCFVNIVRNSFKENGKKDSETTISECYCPFLFNKESPSHNTEFEAIYHYSGYEYKYGYIYNKHRIEYEWLYRKSLDSNRQSLIFERSPDNIKLGSSVRGSCEKYMNDIDSNVLALSFYSSLKLRSHVFRDVLFCLNEILVISFSCNAQSEYMIDRYFKLDFDDAEKPKLLAFLNAIDVGIKDIAFESSNNNEDFAVYTYHADYSGNKYRIPLEIESDGTQRAIALYSVVRLAALYNRGLLIDEFNNQLHPLLQRYIISLLYEESATGQLIYTTHDTSLLNNQFMRRDQIWFTEKNAAGEASLYSLAEYKVRNDKSFVTDYLSGIYGGIPDLKSFSFKES